MVKIASRRGSQSGVAKSRAPAAPVLHRHMRRCWRPQGDSGGLRGHRRAQHGLVVLATDYSAQARPWASAPPSTSSRRRVPITLGVLKAGSSLPFCCLPRRRQDLLHVHERQGIELVQQLCHGTFSLGELASRPKRLLGGGQVALVLAERGARIGPSPWCPGLRNSARTAPAARQLPPSHMQRLLSQPPARLAAGG